MYVYQYKNESLEHKTMAELILLTEKCLDERDVYNKTALGLNKQTDRNDSDVKKFFLYFNNVKKCVEENRFTDGFENAMKLKLHLSSNKIFHLLVGDFDLAPLFCQMTKIVTSRFFSILEKIEENLKLEQNFTISKLLEL